MSVPTALAPLIADGRLTEGVTSASIVRHLFAEHGLGRVALLDRSWVEDRSRTVRNAFDDERGVLLPLPDDPFPTHERIEVQVGKTPYVRFDLNDYSVPHDRTQRTWSSSRSRSASAKSAVWNGACATRASRPSSP